MGSLGYLMKSSEIKDILVEGGICQAGTANKIMAGKYYYK